MELTENRSLFYSTQNVAHYLLSLVLYMVYGRAEHHLFIYLVQETTKIRGRSLLPAMHIETIDEDIKAIVANFIWQQDCSSKKHTLLWASVGSTTQYFQTKLISKVIMDGHWSCTASTLTENRHYTGYTAVQLVVHWFHIEFGK